MTQSDFSTTLQSTKEIELTVTGRKSGRHISNPVWFVREGEKLYLIPVKGSDSDWYKNVRKTPKIHLSTRGKTFTANAMPITDATRVGDVVEKLREKYGTGQVKAYYSKLDVAVEVPLM